MVVRKKELEVIIAKSEVVVGSNSGEWSGDGWI